MAAAFVAAHPDTRFAERLLAALEAAAAEGGDVRGRQSAALLVVAAEPTGKPWEDVLIDVRVDDHPDPLRELRRLVNVNRVWGHVLKWYATEGLLSGEMLATPAEVERVAAELTEAQEVLGDGNQEPMLWRGILFARAGRLDEARRDLMTAVENHPPFAEFLQRLAAAGFLPDSGVLRDIGAA
jgi:hypothetical protein